MPIVAGPYLFQRKELPAEAVELQAHFVYQLINNKNAVLMLYPSSEPDFELAHVRYTVKMEFRQILLRDRTATVAHGLGQIVVTNRRIIGMITNGSVGKITLSESAGSVYTFAIDLDDIRPAEITEKDQYGKPIKAILRSKEGQSSLFDVTISGTSPGLFLSLKDDGQATLSLFSTFLDQLTPEGRKALQVTQNQTSRGPTALNDMAEAAFQRYQESGQLADLDQAVQNWLEALRLTPSEALGRTDWLSNLAVALIKRYTHVGDLADLGEAIGYLQQAAEAVPVDSPDRAMYLHNLANTLSDRYARSGNLADLEAALSSSQKAVETASADSPRRPMFLNGLGDRLLTRYARSGNPADLETAIIHFQQAVKMTPANSPDWTMYLHNLATALSNRYARVGNLADLEAALSASRQTVEATPADSPNRPMYLNNLGGRLRDLYICTGNPADLDAAIGYLQQAIETTPANSPDLLRWLNNLAVAVSDRYTRTGNPTDLETAITYRQQVVQATAVDSPDLSTRLNNLGNSLSDRYARTGNLIDLETAIAHFQQAVKITPADSPDLQEGLNNLGIGLRDRYIRTLNLADLEAAITHLQQAVQITPANSPDQPGHLSNLAGALMYRYTSTGNLTALEVAIAHFQQAVEATPADSPDLPGRLYNLGSALLERNTSTDLDKAIAHFQRAVQTTPSDSPNLPMYLVGLGDGLRSRYTGIGNVADLDLAVAYFQQAVQMTSSDSPEKSLYLNYLGNGLQDRYTFTQKPADLEATVDAWEKNRFLSHSHFADLPVTYQLGQQRQGAETVARLITNYLLLAEQSPSHAPGIYQRALEIAEGNKSRLLTQLVGRGPLPLPSGLPQEIAFQEQRLLTELTSLDTHELTIHAHSVPMQTETSRLPLLHRRQAALHELEALWTQIAQNPGGAEYVAIRRSAPPTWEEFTQLAQELGPNTGILSFFTTSEQALFFLFRAGWNAPRVVSVPLNKAGWTDLLQRFFREVHRGLRRNETWYQPLRPLLMQAQHHLEGIERLVLSPAGNGHWLPWGVLSEYVGWHTPAGQPLPLVTLPALTVLPRLRKRPRTFAGPVLVVGDPIGDLPNARDEAKAVAELFKTKALLGAAATKSAVLARFADASLIHFATHAFFDQHNPLESGILLADGVLSARDILQHRLRADLLVLSACESGQVGFLGGEELAGLSQAFLQAGIRSLLVSLWNVNDESTAHLMRAFYNARLAKADKAAALRQAMTQLQQKNIYWSHSYYWGSFTLIGDWD